MRRFGSFEFKKMKQIKKLREEATELFFGQRYTEARIKIMEAISLVKEADELQNVRQFTLTGFLTLTL